MPTESKPKTIEDQTAQAVDPAAICSLLVDCTEDEETFTARKPHNRLRVWKGRDFWHKQIDVQVRLEPDGRIYLSTQEGHVSTLRSATITVDQLHALIRGVTANVQAHTREGAAANSNEGLTRAPGAAGAGFDEAKEVAP